MILFCIILKNNLNFCQDVSQTFGLDKTESETLINTVDMPQSVSEQEENVECTVQNNYNLPPPGIESDNTDIQISKEIDEPPVQYATETHSVSKIQRNIFILIMIT